ELSRIVHEKKLDRVCTIGAGAGALLTVQDLQGLREDLESSEAVVLSNNSYSADLVAFTPASALDAIDLPATDNPLPRRLHQQAGLSSRQMEKSAASLLDVDTPTDAARLARHPRCPAELRDLPAWQGELGDGMLFDMLVLFAHLGWRPGAEERFASYLFMAERIAAKPLREFTEAARDAPFPLLLGGHTLVSGAFWTMVEAAWAGHPEI